MAKKNIKDSKDINRFEAEVNTGLSEEQVKYMQDNGRVNITKSPTNKTYGQIIFGNIFTFFNVLMFAIAILLIIIVGQKVVLNLMFLIIIFFNILIGTIQECKSKHTIEKLKLLADSKIKVRRNGQELEILPKDIVLDDIVLLSAGDQIPIDCIILEDNVVEVNESLLTGESVPVKKSKGEMLFAGSFVVSGYSAVRADKIGNDTYVQSIENKAKLAKQPKSQLMIAIYKIIRVMAFIAIPLSIIVFLNEFLHSVANNPDALPMFPSRWNEENLISNAVFYGGTTITYMIPCGMALLASIAMATGVVNLAKSQTLAQNLYSVESLSRVNTLCLDKTGTLTDGTMSVEDYKVLSNEFDNKKVEDLISSYESAFKALNQTANAMVNRFGTEAKYDVVDSIEFSSARKYSAVKFKDEGWFILGAPEYITKDKELLEQVNEHAKNGLRVILLAKVFDDFKDQDKIPEHKENIAMFIIRDTIRPEVKPTMEWFRQNDVDIKVISGDNIGTVSYIAKQSGIENWDKVVDMSLITEDDDLEEIVMNNSIFGRVNPDQKAEIIAILKKHNRVVGVTGDGLNDLLAFKNADCSIALANGAAATKNVANLILLDSNFANMKEAVFQGRRVVNNIQRSSTLFVMKDFLWMFITILPILLGVQHVIQPTVMTIVNMFITGVASLFISLEPDKTRVTGNFFRNVVEKAILAGFYMFIPVLIIVLYFILSSIARTGAFDVTKMMTVFEGNQVSSLGWIPLIAICVTISGFIIFYDSCKPMTKYRKILFFSTLIFVILLLYMIPDYFIISGTELVQSQGGFFQVYVHCVKQIVPNLRLALYLTMTLEQLIVLVAYGIVAYPLYILNKKIIGKILDRLLFTNREYKDY